MSTCSPDRRQLLALLPLMALAPATAPARAAGHSVHPFDGQTWQALRQQVDARRQPQLVVFSATWCAVCPGVIAQLAGDPRRRRAGAALWVVLSDVAPGEADARLLASPHHAGADRLLAFDGPAAAIRHAVDPRWRGVAPFVAWLAPGLPPQFVQGAPAATDLERWFASAAR